VGVASVLLNAALSVSTAPYFGYRGIALSASIAAIVNAGLLAVLLRRSTGGLDLPHVLTTFAKVAIAAAAMAATAVFVLSWLEGAMPGPTVARQIVRLGAAILAALFVLAAGASLLRIREFEDVRDGVRRRLARLGSRR
jgi:putative peptidoglycan lipid II flippase